MIYNVISQLTLGDEFEENKFEFDNYQKAADYYRDGFSVMAETIVDFGGDFVITMYTDHGDIVQRHTINTTINNSSNG